jgi:hypothetical protein
MRRRVTQERFVTDRPRLRLEKGSRNNEFTNPWNRRRFIPSGAGRSIFTRGES